MENTVIKCKSEKHGRKIIKYFENLGFDTLGYDGSNMSWYYGVINNKFEAWNRIELNEYPDIKIIKLPKKVSEYPKVMWVSENKDFICKQKRVVFMEKSGLFIAWNNAETIEDSELSMDIVSWRYAKDIEILTITKKQVADKFEVDINDLIIE